MRYTNPRLLYFFTKQIIQQLFVFVGLEWTNILWQRQSIGGCCWACVQYIHVPNDAAFERAIWPVLTSGLTKACCQSMIVIQL